MISRVVVHYVVVSIRFTRPSFLLRWRRQIEKSLFDPNVQCAGGPTN